MRNIVAICIAYIIGIIVGLYSLYIALLFFVFTMIVVIINRFYKVLNKNLFITLCAFFIIGIVLSNYKMQVLQNKYSGTFNDSAIVTEFLESGDYYNKYLIINSNNDKFILYAKHTFKINERDLIEFKGEFKRPQTARNKGCFDYSKYLYSQNIYGSIVVDENDIQVVGYKKSIIHSIKTSIIDSYRRILPNDLYGLLTGMIIGNTTFINDDILVSFQNSGITHLLAVSRKQCFLYCYSN